MARAYILNDDQIAEAEKHIARLAKTATRLGVPAPELLPLAELIETDTEIDEETGEVYEESRAYNVVAVSDIPTIKMGGWTLGAMVEPTPAGNLVTFLPAWHSEDYAAVRTDCIERWGGKMPTCDHCGATRRRSRLYVVQADDSGDQPAGTLLVVGSGCLKDFTGHTDAETLVRLIEQWGTLARDEEVRSGGRVTYSIEAYVCAVAASIRVWGWRRAASDYTPTWQDALDLMTNLQRGRTVRETASQWSPVVETTSADYARTLAALRAIRELPAEEARKSDYVHNLRVACSNTELDGRKMKWGLVASLFAWYDRHMMTLAASEARLRAAQERSERTQRDQASKHQGTVGERLNALVLTVRGTWDISSDYGPARGHRLVDACGNHYSWRSSAGWYDVGEVLHIKAARVKSHWRDRDGIQMTEITRPNITEVMTPAAAATA